MEKAKPGHGRQLWYFTIASDLTVSSISFTLSASTITIRFGLLFSCRRSPSFSSGLSFHSCRRSLTTILGSRQPNLKSASERVQHFGLLSTSAASINGRGRSRHQCSQIIRKGRRVSSSLTSFIVTFRSLEFGSDDDDNYKSLAQSQENFLVTLINALW